MRNWSIPAGKILGVELRLHLSFAFVLLFVSLNQQTPHTLPNPWRGVALAAIVFGSVVLHELAYILLETRSGVAPRAIVLYPLCGVRIFDESQPPLPANWKRTAAISATGPLVHFAIAGVAAMFVGVAAPQARIWNDPFISPANLPHGLIWTNLWLGIFHLLPAYPMDGGRTLRAIFGRTMDPLRATRRAISIGRGFGIAFILAGWWNMPQTTWFCVVGVLLFIAAQMEDRSAVFHSVLETVHLEDIMLTDFATLSPADTLEDALEKAVHCLQDDFPVIRSGDMVGVVSRQKILQTLRTDGNGYVQSVMNKIFDVAQKSESLSSAFRKLSAQNVSILPVVENQQLVGIITLQNLMHSMALLAETRKLRKAALES
jgi:Zn-dependent protease/predicted transcriptional regulator